MEWTHALVLIGTGLAAGFVGALVGIGGGVIFAPVLLWHFHRIGVGSDVLAPLTIGTSLFGTFVVGLSSAWFHHQKGAVAPRVALGAGLLSAVAIFLMTRYVTTQPWYDARVFQVVFSIVLLVVVTRMLLGQKHTGAPEEAASDPAPPRWPVLAGIGSVAGIVSAAAGVGGGVVLVPLYHRLLRLPMRVAVGTSSATIVLISLMGILNYAAAGVGAGATAAAVGYVDFGYGLLLAAPAIAGAPAGVWVVNRINPRVLQWSFAVLAAFVAVRLLLGAL